MDAGTRRAAQGLLQFIHSSPTPFHAVETALGSLRAAGFEELSEGDAWACRPGGKYWVTRNGSSLAAWIQGSAAAAEAGFRVVGAHTDSPGLRLKPEPAYTHEGYEQLGVEVYGGPILASWVDRDLGLAGRVCLRGRTGTEMKLLRIDRPVARIPEVAIHLDREVNDKGLLLNREAHLPPVLGLGAKGSWDLHAWLGAELKVDPKRILDQDLMLFDLTPPAFGGRGEEFLFASRLDNLHGCYCALQGLLEKGATRTESTRLVVLYDNEEIGSATRQGAAGPFLEEILARLAAVEPPPEKASGRGRKAPDGPGGAGEALFRARSRSWLISTDMAHALHPNYAERHEARHQSRLNHGPVIKYNANARYATDAASGAFFQALCQDAKVPYQKYVNRADLPCGSTIGPLVSTRLGIRTVDIGSSQLSMHSCREMSGAHDVGYMIRALGRFFSA